MKPMHLLAALVAAPAMLAFATPAVAQNYPLTGGDYAEVTDIKILPGAGVEYANWLATQWKKQPEYAKSQGWITGYTIYSNVYNRENEADLYLMVTFKSLPDAAEQERRDDAFRKFMAQNDAQMEAASGDRGKFRKVMSHALLQEMKFK
jgi:hypothetical protein